MDPLSLSRRFYGDFVLILGLDGMGISEELIKAIIEKDFVARDYINTWLKIDRNITRRVIFSTFTVRTRSKFF